ncbi:TSUP family transporter [Desulfofundulus thermobenzoicus]|uniref:Probable membrane transporter protein n=1 Tax=Desulfofundulus thermobenzoicus TaxID=29376 RepID=A0A6N7IMD4_9FIRM|nr:sulfite exporter TauE/SafE family protein [Desulfofundulus thermobenzoicus]MQL51132.1 TSUP family transporter [Desulfofundulus thermobenzoicus]
MVHMPISGVEMAWWPLLLIGFTVGVVGGFFGIGGAWLVTPSLNIFGFPMIYAVGTDMTHLVGKSIVSTFRHWKFGHVSVVIAFAMLIGTFSGIETGAQLLLWLTKKGLAGSVVRYAYMILLVSIGTFMLSEYLKARKQEKETGKAVKDIVGTSWSRWIQETLDIWPTFYCGTAKMRISLWAILFVGVVTGFVAGILGVGGGIIRVPALIYLMGVPTKIAVGTDLFEVMFSGAYGCFTYSMKGSVELLGAVIMLLGAAVGAQFGTVATKYVYGITIRLVFALATYFCLASVVIKEIASRFEPVYKKGIETLLAQQGFNKAQISAMIYKKDVMHHYMVDVAHRPDWYAAFMKSYLWTQWGGIVMLTAASGICLYIIVQLVLGIQKEKRAKEAAAKANIGA